MWIPSKEFKETMTQKQRVELLEAQIIDLKEITDRQERMISNLAAQTTTLGKVLKLLP